MHSIFTINPRIHFYSQVLQQILIKKVESYSEIPGLLHIYNVPVLLSVVKEKKKPDLATE